MLLSNYTVILEGACGKNHFFSAAQAKTFLISFSFLRSTNYELYLSLRIKAYLSSKGFGRQPDCETIFSQFYKKVGPLRTLKSQINFIKVGLHISGWDKSYAEVRGV